MVTEYRPWAIALGAMALISWLQGCSTIGAHPSILPDEGPTTLQVYEGAVADEAPAAGTEVYDAQADLQRERDPALWARNANNELNNLFPRVPNHEITGYVFPHLTPRGRPVPGYSTSFMVYERAHYALPGEAAAVAPAGQEQEQ